MAALNGVQSRKVLVDVTHLVPSLQHSQHELQQHKAGMQGTSKAGTLNVSRLQKGSLLVASHYCSKRQNLWQLLPSQAASVCRGP